MTRPEEQAAGPGSGRVDAADGPRGRRWHQVVQPETEADRPGVALLGFASDAGVSRNHGRPGAAEGPTVLRRALANLAWHGGDGARLYDAGTVSCANDALEDAQSAYAGRLAALLRDGHFLCWYALYFGHVFVLWRDDGALFESFFSPCLVHSC